MRVFIDSGIYIAFRNTRDLRHKRATEIITSIAKGEYDASYDSFPRKPTALAVGRMGG